MAETLLPQGQHGVEVAVLDAKERGRLYLRDMNLASAEWTYAGLADFTWSQAGGDESANAFVGDDAQYGFDDELSGRLALFTTGRWRNGWSLTGKLDTREGELDELFSNLLRKDPESLLRRLDPDVHYPTFGDDSQVTDLAPTQGKLFVALENDQSRALWGNYQIGYHANELAPVDRALYGANGRWTSAASTDFGERRLALDVFGAEPGTVPSRQEFRGTGGSFYYLRHQDLLRGSEQVRIEVRDKATGIVSGVRHLTPGTDYDMDYLQGTVLLAEPLNSRLVDDLLVRRAATDGDEAVLVVNYEYTPGFQDLSTTVVGGQGHYWLTDFLKVGFTYSERNDDASSTTDSALMASDVTLRLNADTWLKVQQGRSEGLSVPALYSADGGFGFTAQPALTLDTDAKAQRQDLSVGLTELLPLFDGRMTLYSQRLDAGYAAPGLITTTDTDAIGGRLDLSLGERLTLAVKSDHLRQDQGLNSEQHELDLSLKLGRPWTLSSGLRQERLTLEGVTLPLQQEGERTDAVLQLGYAAAERWSAYGFVQDTIEASGARQENARVGVGGSILLSQRLNLEAEISDGDLGKGGRVGTRYLHSDRSQFYLNYALEAERSDFGQRPGREGEGSLVAGMKTRLGDSTSVYVEERYLHGGASGLTHAAGVQLAPTQHLNLAIGSDTGTLRDRYTGAETERVAGSLRIGYGFESLAWSSGVEYRDDATEQAAGGTIERKSWLYRNALRWQFNPALRLLGKFDYATSDSSQGTFFAGKHAESSLGLAFRPIMQDRLNALVKYTYLDSQPSVDQVTLRDAAAGWLQRSHVIAADVGFDLTPRLRLGGKIARRVGELSLEREEPQWFANEAWLYVLRTDWRVREKWELLVEGRLLQMPTLEEERSGALIALSRKLGDHVKAGVGYNFTEFSDDLTDLSFNNRGLFLNVTGSF